MNGSTKAKGESLYPPKGYKLQMRLPIWRVGSWVRRELKLRLDGWDRVGFIATLDVNDSNSLQTIRNQLAKDIDRLTTELLVARGKLEQVDQIIALGVVSTPSPLRPPAQVSVISLGPTEAALAIVREYGTKEALPNRRIRELMEHHGYQKTDGSYPITVSKSLRRLKDTGRIEGSLVNGEWLYRARTSP